MKESNAIIHNGSLEHQSLIKDLRQIIEQARTTHKTGIVGIAQRLRSWIQTRRDYDAFNMTPKYVRENPDVNDGILVRTKDPNEVKTDNIGINLHTSSNTRASSNGCQNVPNQQYFQFMNEIRENNGQSNKENPKKPLTIQYILTDASKIRRQP